MKNKTLADATMSGVKKQYARAKKISNLSIRNEIWDLRREQATYALSISSLGMNSVNMAIIGTYVSNCSIETACYVMAPLLATAAVLSTISSAGQIKMNYQEIKNLKEKRDKYYKTLTNKIYVPNYDELQLLKKCKIKYIKNK